MNYQKTERDKSDDYWRALASVKLIKTVCYNTCQSTGPRFKPWSGSQIDTNLSILEILLRFFRNCICRYDLAAIDLSLVALNINFIHHSFSIRFVNTANAV